MSYTSPKTDFAGVQPYQFSFVDSRQAETYQSLTYPRFHALLQTLTDDSSAIAIGVELEGTPVGLALARTDDSNEAHLEGQILSLFVVPNHRHQGLGRALLSHLEIELQQRGCQQVEISYLSSPSSPALERILAQQQWFAPQATALVCYASTDRVEQAPPPHLTDYLDRLLQRLPSGYAFFPWHTLTAAERVDLEQQMQTDTLMQRFNPFLEEDKLEPLNSLGLRDGERIIGWVITHRIAPDIIRYTQMYVDPGSQPLSRSTLLLAKAIQLQVTQLPHTQGTFRVDIDNTAMVRFVYRRLKPYLEDVRTAYSATKFLQ
jgi:GNAT superfamily N-acetyltransferase